MVSSSWFEQMGCCVSTSSQSTSSSRSNDEVATSCCFGITMCGKRRTRRTISDHANMLKHLSSIPNRIFTNGVSRSSCIFTQQGRKGINQDAMIVWEVRSFLFVFEVVIFFPFSWGFLMLWISVGFYQRGCNVLWCLWRPWSTRPSCCSQSKGYFATKAVVFLGFLWI